MHGREPVSITVAKAAVAIGIGRFDADLSLREQILKNSK